MGENLKSPLLGSNVRSEFTKESYPFSANEYNLLQEHPILNILERLSTTIGTRDSESIYVHHDSGSMLTRTTRAFYTQLSHFDGEPLGSCWCWQSNPGLARIFFVKLTYQNRFLALTYVGFTGSAGPKYVSVLTNYIIICFFRFELNYKDVICRRWRPWGPPPSPLKRDVSVSIGPMRGQKDTECAEGGRETPCEPCRKQKGPRT